MTIADRGRRGRTKIGRAVMGCLRRLPVRIRDTGRPRLIHVPYFTEEKPPYTPFNAVLSTQRMHEQEARQSSPSTARDWRRHEFVECNSAYHKFAPEDQKNKEEGRRKKRWIPGGAEDSPDSWSPCVGGRNHFMNLKDNASYRPRKSKLWQCKGVAVRYEIEASLRRLCVMKAADDPLSVEREEQSKQLSGPCRPSLVAKYPEGCPDTTKASSSGP
ncbi:hypothetical protein GLOTRDRAFT_96752 [Gloeophyllum trabeum ATCC 11539]|uniref:Uncharacterized protein n=1 Tax=Gloeophyllum trabeum (strain ATCC 11539 / FP-39264 / Madison 617) TaxID=670483 RepID=S7PTP7_GLOTA|nr:uncharacterized protein GLOTRDRAFT_96752 [Gloeophyllum trabeum ATCC 11539]EPQ50818.1 hypothetical protein GLOTRDRAFT_96752 [Gloeophyllum trabeum ATCC 11539]